MGFWGWWNRAGAPDARMTRWRDAWSAAVAARDRDAAQALDAQLGESGLPDDDVEIEREMLEGLQRLIDLASSVDSSGLPAIPTGHRVAGSDVCHFTAPASMPDEPGQPGGRLLLTSGRCVLAGAARAPAVPWHAVTDVIRRDRDLVLVRRGTQAAATFRFNCYADALCAAYLAERLRSRRP